MGVRQGESYSRWLDYQRRVRGTGPGREVKDGQTDDDLKQYWPSNNEIEDEEATAGGAQGESESSQPSCLPSGRGRLDAGSRRLGGGDADGIRGGRGKECTVVVERRERRGPRRGFGSGESGG